MGFNSDDFVDQEKIIYQTDDLKFADIREERPWHTTIKYKKWTLHPDFKAKLKFTIDKATVQDKEGDKRWAVLELKPDLHLVKTGDNTVIPSIENPYPAEKIKLHLSVACLLRYNKDLSTQIVDLINEKDYKIKGETVTYK